MGVGGGVWVGVEGGTGGPRGGEPRVPGVRGHVQEERGKWRVYSKQKTMNEVDAGHDGATPSWVTRRE